MRKWLAITFVVFFVFFIFILLLGYMLQTNKKETFLLKNELEQARTTQQEKKKGSVTKAILSYEQDDSKQREIKVNNIIANGLTCVEVSQCKSVVLTFNNRSCVVAVNSIAFSQLNKLDLSFNKPSFCTKQASENELRCRQNSCQFN